MYLKTHLFVFLMKAHWKAHFKKWSSLTWEKSRKIITNGELIQFLLNNIFGSVCVSILGVVTKGSGCWWVNMLILCLGIDLPHKIANKNQTKTAAQNLLIPLNFLENKLSWGSVPIMVWSVEVGGTFSETPCRVYAFLSLNQGIACPAATGMKNNLT